MQNKPNSPNVQIYINDYDTKDYKIFIPLAGYKNKPNSNPIKPNLRKAKMNVNILITKDYRKNDDFVVRINKPNSKPISVKLKMSANLYVIEDYDNETAFRPQKNKPKQSQFQTGHLLFKRMKQKFMVLPHSMLIRCSCKRSIFYMAFLLKELSHSVTVPPIFDLAEEM